MGELTLSDIQGDLVLVVAIISSVVFLGNKIRDWLHTDIQSEIKPLNDKVDELNKVIKSVDIRQTKDYLVRTLSDVERGIDLTEIEKKRLKGAYDYYRNTLHENSYIKDKYEKAKEDGKI